MLIIVQKIAYYEGVHKIKTLNDLKNRFTDNKRCFIYTHSCMPNEPLVILHIALTNDISSNIKHLLDNIEENSDNVNYKNKIKINKPTNAIFYSITSCQKGLQQVDLGNALIKSCVQLIKQEVSQIVNFHTLSPIPNFREWLDMKLSSSLSIEKDTIYNVREILSIDETSILRDHFGMNSIEENFNHKLKVH
jgi:malonyl-CoA decarboxylase